MIFTIFLTVKPRFKKSIRVCIFAIGFLGSIALSVAFARTINEVLASISLYIGIVYFMFMVSFVREYVCLICKSLTMKEAIARKKTAKDYCISD